MSKATHTLITAPEVVVAPSCSEDFGTARTYLQMAKVSMAQAAAFMVLAGGELERLHQAHGVRRGRPTNYSRNIAGINWSDLVEREMGISEDTANRYREMFKAAKKRVPLLNAEELLTTPLRDLPELRQAQLLQAVQKVTDGHTAQQLMWDWGIARNPQTGGHRPRLGPAPTEEDRRQAWLEDAHNRSMTVFADLHVLDERWKTLEEPVLALAVEDAKRFVAEAEAWLKTPAPARVAIALDKHLKAAEAGEGAQS